MQKSNYKRGYTMGNLIDYIHTYGQFSFEERPFNEIDNLILSQLSYLKFDGIVPNMFEKRNGIKLLDILTHPKREAMFADERFEAVNRSLFESMVFSKRFQTMSLNHYINITDCKKESQFSAITFFFGNQIIYVAYRGTDETIVGWKEDFNMTFLSPVPAQEQGTNYLNQIGKKLKRPFYVGGHSKGGNVAVYASMKCKKEIQKKIKKIYNNDGPGFRKEVFDSNEFGTVKEKIVKIVPQSSLIGMLLQHQEEYQVVKSTGKGGIGQHNPFTWEIEEGEFVYVDDIDKNHKRVNEALNEWVSELNDQQMKIFVDTLYEVVSATDASTLIDLTDDWKDNAIKIVNAFKDVDGNTKKVLLEIVGALFMMNNPVKVTKKIKKKILR